MQMFEYCIAKQRSYQTTRQVLLVEIDLFIMECNFLAHPQQTSDVDILYKYKKMEDCFCVKYYV